MEVFPINVALTQNCAKENRYNQSCTSKKISQLSEKKSSLVTEPERFFLKLPMLFHMSYPEQQSADKIHSDNLLEIVSLVCHIDNSTEKAAGKSIELWKRRYSEHRYS